MTYEYFKANYNKLTRAEINAKENREHRDRYLDECFQSGLQKTRYGIDKGLQDYLINKGFFYEIKRNV